MVLGLLAMTLGVRPLLLAPEARRRGAAWVLVTVALAAAALVVEREGWRRQIRQDRVEAAGRGDAAAVQAAIDDAVDEATRVRMLREAATYWNGAKPQVVELLLRAGTNPNARDGNGDSPWQGVVGNWIPDPGRGAIIRLFLAHGADPNASWDGQTPASIAWAKGDAELLGQLRGAGARDADTHEARFRSLVDAVRSGDLAKVRALREAGVPWTHGGSGGMDASIAAGEEGRTEVLGLFTSTPGYSCAATDAALLAAARHAHQETIDFLFTTCLTLRGVDAATDAAEEAGHVEIGRLLRARPRKWTYP
jgi:hypothetical protein